MVIFGPPCQRPRTLLSRQKIRLARGSRGAAVSDSALSRYQLRPDFIGKSAPRANPSHDVPIYPLGPLVHLFDGLRIIARELLVWRWQSIAIEHPINRRPGRDLNLSRWRERPLAFLRDSGT